MNDIKDLFCNYEISKQLKEIGFNELCLAYYAKSLHATLMGNIWNGAAIEIGLPDNSVHVDVYAPTCQQAIDWFREKHNLEINASFYIYNGKLWTATVTSIINDLILYEVDFKDYYSALNNAIESAIKIIDKK